MLPLRSNRKPQLLPIKQLLMKRDESTPAEEEHNLNTDDYLLWKSEHDLSGKNDNRLQRTKHDVFLRDTTGIWDSDDADDSLQNQFEKLNNLKYYDYESSSRRLEQHENMHGDKSRNKKRVTSLSSQAKTDSDLMKKLIEMLDLPIKESIDKMQRNLSTLLEIKIREEISSLQNNAKIERSDSDNDVSIKITNIFENLQKFEKSHQQELIKLRSEVLDRLNSLTINQNSSNDDVKKVEERICNQIRENFKETTQNLEDQIKQLNDKYESYKVGVEEKYEKIFHENAAKLEKLDEKLESLSRETSKILEVIADSKPKNSKPLINMTLRQIAAEEMFKIDDINSSSFYRKVDAELEEYRNIYVNSNIPIDQYQALKKPSMLSTNNSYYNYNKWKPWE